MLSLYICVQYYLLQQKVTTNKRYLNEKALHFK